MAGHGAEHGGHGGGHGGGGHKEHAHKPGGHGGHEKAHGPELALPKRVEQMGYIGLALALGFFLITGL